MNIIKLNNNKEVFILKNNKCFEQSVATNEIAQAYVPMQFFCPLYNPQKALLVGTVFPVLNK